MLSVDVLRLWVGQRAQHWLDVAVLLACLTFFGLLTWVGIQMTWRVRFQTMPSLEWSISWVYIAIPIGAVLAILGLLARWLEKPAPAVVDNTQL